MTRFLMTAAAILVTASPALADVGDAAAGEKEFRKCKACHTIASDDEVFVRGGKTGPNLYGVIGRTAGTYEDFRYGDSIVELGEQGLVWDVENIQTYMTDPRAFLQEQLDDGGARTKMTFKLTRGQEDMAAYLATFSDDSGEEEGETAED
ncbi:c-type cytochrome [Pseudooceanicola marinus]|uniref:c-type cytochrome n=1 Tax=Pseudooceanicola marinus TaxID=396013 RepID=UPI001C96B98E|nr:hypothetical protein [Pseudooceanicola marinus]MBY5972967.1 hypothetical protein [Ferrimonas balearica]MCA1336822.1 cytochrome C [Pseudooceanicola marinus]